MRQILIKKNIELKSLYGDQIELLSNEKSLSQVKGEGVTLVRFPLKMDVITGGNLTVKFELSKNMAKMGVILLGAYYENSEVEAILMSGSSQPIQVKNKTHILTATIVETATYRQVDEPAGLNLNVKSALGAKAVKKRGQAKKAT